MKDAKNPFGLHTITPYLVVQDTKRLINFLETVFSGKLRGEISYREDKTVQHAEVKIGDSVIMMGEPLANSSNVKTTSCGMYIYVDDCDSVYHKAIAAGGKSLIEPADHPHGDRYGGVLDFAGNSWWIVSHNGKINSHYL